MEKENQSRLKKSMESYIKDSKQDRDQEKKERKDVTDFLNKPEVLQVFETYKKQLYLIFKFYASQDNKKDSTSFDLDYLHNVLSFQELVRFGYQQSIVP